jgi:hypothetical protein
MKILAVALMVLFINDTYAKEPSIEVIKAEKQEICQIPNTKLFMPCALMFAMMQKITGAGCGERTCPVKL